MARYAFNGKLDNAFSTDGVAHLPVGDNQLDPIPLPTGSTLNITQNGLPTAATLAADGSVVVAGSWVAGSKFPIPFFVRFKPNGSIALSKIYAFDPTRFVINGPDGNHYTGLTIKPNEIAMHSDGDLDVIEIGRVIRFSSSFSVETTFADHGQLQLNSRVRLVGVDQQDQLTLAIERDNLDYQRDATTSFLRYSSTGVVSEDLLAHVPRNYIRKGIRLRSVRQTPDGAVFIVGENLPLRRAIPAATEPNIFYSSSARQLSVIGSDGDDDIQIRRRASDGRIVVSINGRPRSFADTGINKLHLLGGDGDDSIVVTETATALSATIEGGRGDDFIHGTARADLIYGREGSDTVYAAGGNNTIWGEAGDDKLTGGGDYDLIYGNKGKDTISGASANDTIFGGADAADDIDGGPGVDQAARDDKDTFFDIEQIV